MELNPTPTFRACHDVLNSLHSTLYFAPELDAEFALVGIEDSMDVYLAARAAPLGAVGPGVVSALFYSFAPTLIADHLPQLWSKVQPERAVRARLHAAEKTLYRLVPAELIDSPSVSEMAELALSACDAASPEGRPMFAALADAPIPTNPLLALWSAATMLREHRGDAHVSALMGAELSGLEALVSHSASSAGMPKEIVMQKRGWTENDWIQAQDSLRSRGALDGRGALTPAGQRLREQVEAETDRLDRQPYRQLGEAPVQRLTGLAGDLLQQVVVAGAFPPALAGFFERR